MNEIDEILKKAEENGIDEDIIDYIEHLKLDNEELKSKNNSLETKNQRLMNGASPSILQKYRTANANLKNEKKELNAEIKKLQRKKSGNLSHLDAEQLGVQQRMLDDFNGMERYTDKTFPGENHPIFARFNELANKFPSRRMIVNGITAELKHQEELIDFEIETQKKNINIWNNCDKLVKSDPNGWEEQVSNQEAYLYKVTTPQDIEEKIKRLKEDKSKISEWSRIKNNIQQKQESDVVYHENNAYHDIINEFKRIYFFCTNVGGVTQYKANVRVDGFNQADMYSSLTRELERQIGLCEEPYTHNFFYSNGEGRLIPYELNRDLLRYVNENTTFIKYGKKNQYKSGNVINSKVLFEDIPLYCNKIQYRNPNLVGFNNCFYDITKGEIVDLNPQAPILPLKNTKTELYLDAHIEDNPMRKIFYECFTEKDRKTLLAYIGCALYDKGYTQRQESLFIMGRGGTGKTTLTKAICSIFYSVGHQLVTKLTDNNQFGFSMFADSDVVIVDEIQSAPKEFAEKIKNISSADALPVEKKHHDTISVPAENVPRVFFIGNNFSRKLYEASDSAGVNRRILIIIPTQPIQDLGYQWKDLITDSCKQWIVQQATKEYIAQGLHKQAKPIASISENEKLQRVELCTFPERFFIDKHFEVLYVEGTARVDDTYKMEYEAFHSFIIKKINEAMVESTTKLGVAQTFINHVKEVFSLSTNYNTRQEEGMIYFKGIVPKTEDAEEFFATKQKDNRIYYVSK